MANKKLFSENEIVINPSGAKKIAIGDDISSTQNITLNDLKKWITGTTAPVTVLTKVVDIGPWNMCGTRDKIVSTGVALSKIRDVQVMVKSDEGIMFPLQSPSESQNCSPGGWFCVCNSPTTNAKIQLVRDDGKKYSSSHYNDAYMNRGYITITHVP